MTPSDWISVNDRLPEIGADGSSAVCLVVASGLFQVCRIYRGHWTNANEDEWAWPGEVTHWMPIVLPD